EGGTGYEYDRENDLKVFDESKTSVKGLVESGVSKIPRIFIHDRSKLDERLVSGGSKFSVPIINLEGIDKSATTRNQSVEKVRDASENWGFFQVVKHGISSNILDEMIDGVGRFHDQDPEVRKKFYAREESGKLMYNTNFDLYQSSAANLRDTIFCSMAPNPPNPVDLPQVCRDIMLEYSNKVRRLGLTLFKLLSEPLGLSRNHLTDMGCGEELFLVDHYYPACPEPDLRK
ncbi:Non-heme dioxygenase N-terminal domain containing protein, partial [Parasponia andersonii]